MSKKSKIEKSEACLAVSCPNCHARKGQLCSNTSGTQIRDHVAREKKFQAKRESDELKQPQAMSPALSRGQEEAAEESQSGLEDEIEEGEAKSANPTSN